MLRSQHDHCCECNTNYTITLNTHRHHNIDMQLEQSLTTGQLSGLLDKKSNISWITNIYSY